MRHTLALCILALSFLLGSQCDSKYVTPPSGPGTQWPCGLQAHPCEVPARTCCPNGSACGDGFHGCPADACCYGGSSMVGATRDGGPAQTTKLAVTISPR